MRRSLVGSERGIRDRRERERERERAGARERERESERERERERERAVSYTHETVETSTRVYVAGVDISQKKTRG